MTAQTAEHAADHTECLRTRLAGDAWCTHQVAHTQPTWTLGYFSHESELYRMRTQSHLYDETTVEHAMAYARIAAHRAGALLADCHRCRATVHVRPDEAGNVRCPICGTDPSEEES